MIVQGFLILFILQISYSFHNGVVRSGEKGKKLRFDLYNPSRLQGMEFNNNIRLAAERKVSSYPTITGKDFLLVIQYWKDVNDHLSSESPSYLSEGELKKKFELFTKSIGDSSSALSIIQADPNILSFNPQLVADSFAAWVLLLGSREEAVRLCARNPSVLSIRSSFVQNASKGDVAQTYLWSYLSVALRPLSKIFHQIFKFAVQ